MTRTALLVVAGALAACGDDARPGGRSDAGQEADCRRLAGACAPGFACLAQGDETWTCTARAGGSGGDAGSVASADRGVTADAAPPFQLDGTLSVDRDGRDQCPAGPTVQPRAFAQDAGLTVQATCSGGGVTLRFDAVPAAGTAGACTELNTSRLCPAAVLGPNAEGVRLGEAEGTVTLGEDGYYEGRCVCTVPSEQGIEGYTLSATFRLPPN